MYVDFEYYRDTYGGTDLTESTFPAASRKAEAYIRYLTYLNGDIFADTAHMDAIKAAVCAAAEARYAAEQEMEEGGNLKARMACLCHLLFPEKMGKRLTNMQSGVCTR